MLVEIYKEMKARSKSREHQQFNTAQKLYEHNKENMNFNSVPSVKNKKTANSVARIQAIHKDIRRRFAQKKMKNEDEELQETISSLMLCEKILCGIDLIDMVMDLDIIRLRLHNAHLLMKAYFKASDYARIVRFLTENTKANMYIKDLILKLSREGSLQDNELQNYVLHIQQILGECHMATKDFKKASTTFYQVCKLYNRWKVNNTCQ